MTPRPGIAGAAWAGGRRPAAPLTLALILALLTACQGPAPRLSTGQFGDPLRVFLSTTVDSTGVLRPYLEVAVPRHRLVFQHQQGEIRGGLEVTVVASRGGRQEGGAVGQTLLSVPDWGAARSDSAVICAVSFALPGLAEADLQVTVRSWGTTRIWERRLVYRPQEWLRLPLAFSGFTWGLGEPAELQTDADTLVIDLALRNLAAGTQSPSPASVGLTFTDAAGEIVRRLEQPLPDLSSAGASLTQEFRIPAQDLPFGLLRVTPFLVGEDAAGRIIRPWATDRDFANFRVAWSDDRSWRDQLAWLTGKFPADELAGLADRPAEQRRAAWLGLWGTACSDSIQADGRACQLAHWRAVRTAEERYSGPGERGSLTDRGRAWIRYGPPDQIDRFLDDRERQGRWEVWYYLDSGLQLSFFSPHGQNDFQLVETLVDG